ncbi:MAG: type I-U CRISPR-associated protein Cas5/Cas6, partial [Lentisphaeria bacterium]|nr:type I-U CRISPR-associated protein Cas5/Cas6 [Lentisphaeria bacterium]
MPTLSIRFTGGHYHATPWYKAQNEGAVEWPPSPWLILRGLLATGYTKLPEWQGGLMPDAAKTLVEKLASVLPAYRLPPATGAHTRHYMPTKSSTTLVLDARIVLGINHAPLLVRWDVVLAPEEEILLASLATCLGYLGRAESWCEAELIPDIPISDDWCVSERNGAVPNAPGWKQIPLIAPITATEYVAWREEALRTSGSKRSRLAIPVDLVSALHCETGTLQKQGWTQPPGSRNALYWLSPENEIGTTRPKPVPRPACKPVHFVLLALAASARSRTPMPLAERTLPQAELLHRTIASHVGRLSGADNAGAASELLGISSVGHRHAHILPLALLKQDNHLDHILLWAPGGLSDASQNILRHIRATYMKGG